MSLTAALALVGAVGASSANAAISADLLIRGGQVYVGDLSAGKTADVAIRGDRIVFVGDAAKAGVTAKKTIDARGKIVSPGFIDPHVHSLEELTSDDPVSRLNIPNVTQGVTTNFIGIDGSGPVEIGKLFSEIDANGVGTNAVSYVGFGTIRRAVLKNDDRQPTAPELAQMKAMAAKAMCEGAIGLSAGLFYSPQSFSTTDEVIEVAKEVGKRGGFYDTHQRDEGTNTIGVLASVQEVLRIGREAGLPTHFSHLKVQGPESYDKMDDVIALIEAEQAAGRKVTANQYPWLASGTGLSAALIPRWAMGGGRAEMLRRFDDPALHERLMTDMTHHMIARGGPKAVLITRGERALVGKTLDEIATAWKLDPREAAIRILKGRETGIASFTMDEGNVRELMVKPWVMTGSDGSDGHPRKYGTYPTLYRKYVVEQKVLTPAQFVHRSAGLVADTFGLKDRGYLKVGYFADVAVIDPATYRAQATYVDPTLFSTGVEAVVVNGKLELEGGQMTGVAAGRACLTNRPRAPALKAQPFSTKESITFFSPAFSKTTVSLLPSTPFTWP